MEKAPITPLTQIFAALTASLGGFAFGSIVSYSSPALPSILKDSNFKSLSTNQESWIASLAPLAALIGIPFIGISIEKFGRKATMCILTIPLLLGWLLLTFSDRLSMIYSGRILTGFSMGGFSLVSPLYISETASESIRGRLTSFHVVAIHLGIVFPYIFGSFLSYKQLALTLCFVPILMAVLLYFVPESPRFLLAKGNTVKATSSLLWLRRTTSVQDVIPEIQMIQKSLDISRSVKLTLRKAFRMPEIVRPTVIGMCLMFFQFTSGIDAITFYNYKIFEDSGSHIDSNLSSIVVGSVQVFAVLIAGVLMDRVGRRPLFLASELIVVVSMFLLGLYFYLAKGNGNTNVGWLPLTSLVIFSLGFPIGLGPIPWIMLEIVPNQATGIVSSLVVATSWCNVFLATKFFSTVQAAVGEDWCFWIFAIFSTIGFIFAFLFLPETKGKTLEQLQEDFRKNKI